MAQFQVQVTMIVEAHSASEAETIADAALDHLVWPGTPILRCTVGEVDQGTPDRRIAASLSDLDNTLD